MTFDQIWYFIEAAKQEHLGRASRILHLSPSTLSHAISSLEEELDLKLFEKRGKNIILSTAGKAFLPSAMKLAQDFRKLQEDFSGKSVFGQMHWNVAASHGLAEVVAASWPASESVDCTLHTLRSAEVITKILDGSCDLGVCYSPQVHPKIDGSVLYTGQLRLAVRLGHPLLLKRNKSPVDLDKLSEYGACLPKSYVGIDVCESHPMLKKHKILPRLSFLFDNYGVAIQRLQNSDDWSLIPDLVSENKGLFLFPGSSDWHAPFSVQMIRLKQRQQSSLETELQTRLKKSFELMKKIKHETK
jgi:DNA-binding transcriptional LysR family regulator